MNKQPTSVNPQCGGYPIPQGICECCGKVRGLITHHWYDMTSLEPNQKQVCLPCNGILTTNNLLPKSWFDCGYSAKSRRKNNKLLDKWNHVLPEWGLQVGYVLAHNKTRIAEKELRNTTSKIVEQYELNRKLSHGRMVRGN